MRLRPPDPPLRDPLIELRPWRPEDAAAIAMACAEKEIARWLDQVPQPYTLRDAQDYAAATKRADTGTARRLRPRNAKSCKPEGPQDLTTALSHGVRELSSGLDLDSRPRDVVACPSTRIGMG